uniref:hypothetical protein n=1 Tax=Mariniflexile sp. TaxID=1979402 RepID=UPI004047C90C
MAEIKIEKKSPVWPWVLLVLAIAVVIAYVVYKTSEDNTYEENVNIENIDGTNTLDENGTANYDDTNLDSNYNSSMMEFDEAVKDSARIGKDSAYTKSAMHKLIHTVVLKADQNNLESSNALTNLKSYADNGMSVTKDLNISKNLKSVSDDVTSVIQAIQTKNFPGLKTALSRCGIGNC